MSRLLSPNYLVPSRRYFSRSVSRTAFATGPAPPRLPVKDQEEFERLQRASNGAFSTPKLQVITDHSSGSSTVSRPNTPHINQSPASRLEVDNGDVTTAGTRSKDTGKGDELHPDIRRGAKPEFEGERNPKTGETGGPKNEPLRWGSTGSNGDWSYNGRVTDF